MALNRLPGLIGTRKAAGGCTISHCCISLGHHMIRRPACSNAVTLRLRQAALRKKPITSAASSAAYSCGFLRILWSFETNAQPPYWPSCPSHSTSGPAGLNLSVIASTWCPSGAAIAAIARAMRGVYVVVDQDVHAAIRRAGGPASRRSKAMASRTSRSVAGYQRVTLRGEPSMSAALASVAVGIPEDDLAHVVIEAVERVEIGAFGVNHRGTGSAQYHPRMMLALLIDCYANGIVSSMDGRGLPPAVAAGIRWSACSCRLPWRLIEHGAGWKTVGRREGAWKISHAGVRWPGRSPSKPGTSRSSRRRA